MFEDAGRPEVALQAMAAPFRHWLESKLAAGAYQGWVAEFDGQAVAGLGLMFIDWPPHPDHPACDRRGYVLNVYVEPEHRRQGLAERLMRMAEDEARSKNVPMMVLHATQAGRRLYERMHWKATTEMSLLLSVPE